MRRDVVPIWAIGNAAAPAWAIGAAAAAAAASAAAAAAAPATVAAVAAGARALHESRRCGGDSGGHMKAHGPAPRPTSGSCWQRSEEDSWPWTRDVVILNALWKSAQRLGLRGGGRLTCITLGMRGCLHELGLVQAA